MQRRSGFVFVEFNIQFHKMVWTKCKGILVDNRDQQSHSARQIMVKRWFANTQNSCENLFRRITKWFIHFVENKVDKKWKKDVSKRTNVFYGGDINTESKDKKGTSQRWDIFLLITRIWNVWVCKQSSTKSFFFKFRLLSCSVNFESFYTAWFVLMLLWYHFSHY